MADENIIVQNQGASFSFVLSHAANPPSCFPGSIFLAGPPLVKAALGEVIDSESLGGGAMHARESGVVDHLATSDEHALFLARQAVASLARSNESSTPPKFVEEPIYDPNEVGGAVGANVKKSFDMREVIARTVDGSRFAEWKGEWGQTVVTGFAHIHGHQVGIVRSSFSLLPLCMPSLRRTD